MMVKKDAYWHLRLLADPMMNGEIEPVFALSSENASHFKGVRLLYLD